MKGGGGGGGGLTLILKENHSSAQAGETDRANYLNLLEDMNLCLGNLNLCCISKLCQAEIVWD